MPPACCSAGLLAATTQTILLTVCVANTILISYFLPTRCAGPPLSQSRAPHDHHVTYITLVRSESAGGWPCVLASCFLLTHSTFLLKQHNRRLASLNPFIVIAYPLTARVREDRRRVSLCCTLSTTALPFDITPHIIPCFPLPPSPLPP